MAVVDSWPLLSGGVYQKICMTIFEKKWCFNLLANVSGRQRSDWCRYCSVHAFQQDMLQVGLNNFTDYTEKYFSSLFLPTWMIQYSVIDQNTLMYTVKLKDLSLAVWLFNVTIAIIPFHVWEIWHSFIYNRYLAISASGFSPSRNLGARVSLFNHFCTSPVLQSIF